MQGGIGHYVYIRDQKYWGREISVKRLNCRILWASPTELHRRRRGDSISSSTTFQPKSPLQQSNDGVFGFLGIQ